MRGEPPTHRPPSMKRQPPTPRPASQSANCNCCAIDCAKAGLQPGRAFPTSFPRIHRIPRFTIAVVPMVRKPQHWSHRFHQSHSFAVAPVLRGPQRPVTISSSGILGPFKTLQDPLFQSFAKHHTKKCENFNFGAATPRNPSQPHASTRKYSKVLSAPARIPWGPLRVSPPPMPHGRGLTPAKTLPKVYRFFPIFRNFRTMPGEFTQLCVRERTPEP